MTLAQHTASTEPLDGTMKHIGPKSPFQISGENLIAAGYTYGDTYEKCLDLSRYSALMAQCMDNLGGVAGSPDHEKQFYYAQMHANAILERENKIYTATGKSLIEAGFIRGQTYEQCVEMAKWHPMMADFMNSLIGTVGSDAHRKSFGFARISALFVLENRPRTVQ